MRQQPQRCSAEDGGGANGFDGGGDDGGARHGYDIGIVAGGVDRLVGALDGVGGARGIAVRSPDDADSDGGEGCDDGGGDSGSDGGDDRSLEFWRTDLKRFAHCDAIRQ